MAGCWVWEPGHEALGLIRPSQQQRGTRYAQSARPELAPSLQHASPSTDPPTLAQLPAALGTPPLANACRTFARRLPGSVLRLETLRQPLGSAPRRSAPATIHRSLRVEASGTVRAADTAMAAEALAAADWEGLCKHIAAYDAQREVVIKACRDVQVMVFRVKEAQG